MDATIILETKRVTLDDLFQLQALLQHEQEERDKHIQACHHHPQHQSNIHLRRAINPQAARQSSLEKERLQQALVKLKYLKDKYRRQRVAEIQAYLEAYRRQALIRAVQQEEEERYYRQCIAAALEQRRVNDPWQKYTEEKRQEALQGQFERQQLLADGSHQEDQQISPEQQQDSDEDEGYSQYHSEQLADVLKQIFFHRQQQEQEQQQKQHHSPITINAKQPESDDAMAEVWKYVSDQKANSETPRTAFLSPDQDQILGNDKSFADDPDVKQTFEAEKSDNELLSDAGSPPPSVSPPLQDHIVTLKDLIQQLASEPVMVGEQITGPIQYSDEPKPSGIWAKQEHKPNRTQSPPASDLSLLNNRKNQAKNEDESDQRTEKKAYLPQHIFTEAEPTPTMENMPDTPIGTGSEGDSQEEDVSHFVDSIAAGQKNEVVPPDPRKLKVQEELDGISNQLSDSSDLVQRWKEVLQSTLEFTKQAEGTLLLNANTEANRQFLGSEDEIMRVMLKLDTIDSLGHDIIRQDRRNLVVRCENMLDQLDHFKQAQWEKVVSSTNQQRVKRSHKHKKKGKK